MNVLSFLSKLFAFKPNQIQLNNAVNFLKEKYGDRQDNIVAIGEGFKESSGVDSFATSIQKSRGVKSAVILVQKKLPIETLAASEVIPSVIDGVQTDIIEVGELRPANDIGEIEPMSHTSHKKKYRPVVGGISAIWYKGTACTLAIPVYIGKQVYALQNAHCGFPHWLGAKKGDPILQPSPNDGGKRKDKIGTAELVKELQFDGILTPNYFDTALVKLDGEIDVKTQELLKFGKIKTEAKDVAVGQVITKEGRTTGLSSGKVLITNAVAWVTYAEGKTAFFEGQIIAENKDWKFIDGGDSSSLVVDEDGYPVGQVFAASMHGTTTTPIGIISPIKPIMSHFGFTFEPTDAPVPPPLNIIQDPSPNFKVGREGKAIKGIVIHITDGFYPTDLAHLKSPASQVSSHYYNAPDGTIRQLVKDENTAWHAGVVVNPTWKLYDGTNPNQYTIGIETSLRAGEQVRPEQRDALVKLIKHLCAKHNIPIHRDHIIRHQEIHGGKSCPALIDVDELVYMAGGTVPPPPNEGFIAVRGDWLNVSTKVAMNIRQSPSTSAPAVRKIEADTKIELGEYVGKKDGYDWHRVKII